MRYVEEAPVHDTAIANDAARFADRFVVPTLLVGAAIFAITRDPVRAAAVIVFAFGTGVRVSVPTTVFGARRGRAVGWIAYADVARAEATEVLRTLHSYGVRRLLMVTGDHRDVAVAVAQEVGIDWVEAEVFPERKAEIVRMLQARGHLVGVVGDGINDSPALGYADVSIALKDSSDVARESADVVLHGDLHGLAEATDIARHAMHSRPRIVNRRKEGVKCWRRRSAGETGTAVCGRSRSANRSGPPANRRSRTPQGRDERRGSALRRSHRE